MRLRDPRDIPGGVAGSADLLLDAYLDHLKVERTLGKKTVEAYALDLSRFLSFLEDHDVKSEKIELSVTWKVPQRRSK